MGIDIYCKDKSFSCSYTSWHNLRSDVIEATFNYLQEEIDKDINENEDENKYNDRYEYNIVSDFLNEIKKDYLYSNKSSVVDRKILDIFISVSESKLCYLDALINFDVGGLYSLCLKSDCEGYYSQGNSIDICKLFDTIKPFLKEINEHTYSAIYECPDCYMDGYEGLYKVFETSWKNNLVVRIS